MTDKVKEFAIGAVGLVTAGFGLSLLGDAYRARPFIFVVVWLCCPVIGCLLLVSSVNRNMTVKNLRNARAALMTVACLISFFFGAQFISGRGDNPARDAFGQMFVSGYKHWQGEGYDDDIGEVIETNWKTDSALGRWAVDAFCILLFAGSFGIPFLTWKACSEVYEHRSRETDLAIERWINDNGFSRFAHTVYYNLKQDGGKYRWELRGANSCGVPESDLDEVLGQLAPIIHWNRQTDLIALRDQ